MENCRICLGNNSDLSSLFDVDENKYLPAIIYNISGVKILRKLEPAARICLNCKNAVIAAEQIILRCQESEKHCQWEKIKSNTNDLNQSPRCIDNDDLVSSKSYTSDSTPNPAHNNADKNMDMEHERKKKLLLFCAHCSFGCRTARGLIKHRIDVHKILDENIFPCNWCDKRYPKKSLLNRHIQNHHKALPDVKKFICVECGNIYPNAIDLTEHQNQRHGPRRFRCVEPNCKQTFTRPFTLRRHFFATHQNKISYYCNDCMLPFKIYDQWKYHNKMVHNNQKRDLNSHRLMS